MKRVCVMFAAAVFLTSPAWPSSATPQQVLIELLLADKAQTVEQYLPNVVQEGLRTLTQTERQAFENKLHFIDGFRRMGLEIEVPGDGHALLVAHSRDGEQNFELRLQRELIAGNEAMLQVTLVGGAALQKQALVWMQLEDGEWRITQLQQLFGTEDILLDDAKFVEQFRDPEVKEAEALELRTLYQLRWALEAYARNYSEGCYPEHLRVLGPGPDDKGQDEPIGPDHAALVAREFASNSFQSNGYKFNYEWNGGMFALLARPVEYRKTGIRSFYVDRSSAIRYTDEDRDATAEDDPAENP